MATTEVSTRLPRIALVGAPNAGKTTIFNALTGLRAKTGNYPGVTVSRSVGECWAAERHMAIEDLPGTYSLKPISPDEQIVLEVLDGNIQGLDAPDAIVVVLDSTTLRRSLKFAAEVVQREQPTIVALTMTDELVRRGGHIDEVALSKALGVPVVKVLAHRPKGADELIATLAKWDTIEPAPTSPPTTDRELNDWVDSILTAANYTSPHPDRLTERLDNILLHPVLGTIVFVAVMFAFFQVIYEIAPPLQDKVEEWLGLLGGAVTDAIGESHPLLAGLIADGVIGGVGGVLSFLPLIALMFLIIGLLENVGYMSRAAFLMDRVMASAGLEGRAFVAFLSSLACAIPGIMATRTLPSAKDRIATMLAAPLMTCSARLPVYVLLIAMVVGTDLKWGPFNAAGVIMFALYFGGGVFTMLVAWIIKKLTDNKGQLLPFYMEMPPYRFPSAKVVALSIWEACWGFVKRAGTIILATTVILWVLLNVPLREEAELSTLCAADQACAQVAAQVEAGPSNEDLAAELERQHTAVAMENSYAAAVGKAVSPVFEPLGYDWRLNIGILSSLAAREAFVATLGQIAAAEDPEDPINNLEPMVFRNDTLTNKTGDKLFNPATIASMLVFFMFALQCFATMGVLRRESGGWKWPVIAFVYMFALAWVGAFIAHNVAVAFIG